MAETDPVVIVGAARTPMGAFQGALKDLSTPELGSVAIKAALERASLAPDQVSEVFMGCVLPAGLGQAPARQASLAAGLPQSIGCTTVNKVCGSGMKAAMLGHDLIRAGSAEIVPVSVKGRGGETLVASDEQALKADPAKIPTLKPAFRPDGTVTAANSSSISDGAAALVLMRRSEAERRGLAPLAEIRAHAAHAQAPAWFTTAPVEAIRRLLDRVGWRADEVDLYEINEAFAVVTMAAMRDLGLPHEKVNPNGGACALGHPIGASGARLIVTLLAALQRRGLKRGIASLCIGGGEATAMAIERLN